MQTGKSSQVEMISLCGRLNTDLSYKEVAGAVFLGWMGTAARSTTPGFCPDGPEKVGCCMQHFGLNI